MLHISADTSLANLEGLLESYTLEEETLDEVQQECDGLKSLYLEKYNNFMKISEETENKKKQLLYLQLSTKQIIKINKFLSENLSALFLHFETAQGSINEDIGNDYKQLDDFTMKSTKTEENLQKLKSKFEEQTLADQLSDVLLQISTSEERKKQLLERLEKLKNNRHVNAELYRPAILKELIEEYRKISDIVLANVQKKLAEREKNLQGLKDEIEKQYEVLASLD